MNDASSEKKIAKVTMRTPFPDNQIGKLAKGSKAQTQCDAKEKINCTICGGWHHPKMIHLDYVGHAALTDRLLDVDTNWTWEPLALKDGLPAFDSSGGLWIKLTVLGITRIGYGNAQESEYKEVGSREKEVIGDALRNAAMRFGAALELWHKGELHVDGNAASKKGVIKPADNPSFKPDAEEEIYLLSVADTLIALNPDYAAAYEKLESEKLDSDEKVWVWNKLAAYPTLRSGIKKHGESIKKSIEA